MKIPLTDKFLLDLYSLIEGVGETFEIPEALRVKTLKQMLNPESCRFWREYRRKQRKKQFAQFIYYLKRKGYIKIKNLEKGRGVLLTRQGQKKALSAKYKLNSKFQKRKDEKWIMVIFDVPEKLRRHRDGFRDFLNSLGFKKLQQSVWVSPYDVYEDLEEIIRIYSFDEFVKIFLIEEIEIN